LKNSDYPGRASGEIYAVFEVVPDEAYAGREWDGKEVVKVLKAFESRRSYRETKLSERELADPRVLSLRELLKAMKP
jgi:hypothetical protein